MLMIIVALVVFGLCMGSFVNALVWRLHSQFIKHKQGKTSSHLNDVKDKDLSIMQGRSMCPNCHHELAARDLVPVLSWLSLRGKCRYCHKPISKQYPLVETLTAALFVFSYIFWPFPITGSQTTLFILWLVLLVGLVALSIYDLHWMILPNRLIYPLSIVALASAVITIVSSSTPAKAALDVFIAVSISGGIFYVLFQVSQGGWIGGGDVKLGWLLGLVVATPGRSILLIFIASLSGCIITLPLMAVNRLKRDSTVPFGPFLIIAAIIVQLFGHALLTRYQNTFFPNGV
jgi:leader peptidase (prepilin peptidase)/N-methyltransferase